jgi:hypothetical protein
MAAFCALAVALFKGLPDLIVTDLSGILFLVVALSYRGSYLSWWIFLGPLALLFLFAPVAHWEVTGAIRNLGDLMRASMVPGLGFIGGAMIITARHMRLRSIEGASELIRMRSSVLKSLALTQAMRLKLQDVVKRSYPIATHSEIHSQSRVEQLLRDG